MSAVNSGCACDSGLMIGRVMRSSKRNFGAGQSQGAMAGTKGLGGASAGAACCAPTENLSCARRFTKLADWLTEDECDD